MSRSKAGLRNLLQYLIIILSTLIISYLIIEYCHPVLVSGKSMEPTLKDGSLQVSINTFKPEDIKKGDIVVFVHDGIQYIKRVVGCPGDEIWIEDKILYVNGEASPYQFDEIENAGILQEPLIIYANEYFCMGDNHNESNDCRMIGVIKFEQIKYKIILNVEKEKKGISYERYKQL